MIYLYDSTTKVFTYNGQPMPKAYEVITDRTINDEFFVTGKHPLDESQRYKLIQKDKIIKAHTPDGMQPFRIMDVNKRLGYVEFEAWPLLYADLRKKLIKPFTLRVATGQSVLNTFVGNLLLDTPFTFNSNIIDTHDFKVQDETEAEQDPNQLYDALDILKRIVNRWGGELIIDGYDIRMVDRIGKDTDALLYEKKNITDFVDKESIQEIVTRLHGKAEWTEDNPNGGDQITKRIQTTVNSPLINAYSGIVFEQQFTNNDIHTEQELKDWLNLKFNTENIDKPSRSIELDTNIIDATEIALGDTLNLKYLKHDVDMQIRVMRYQYDGFYKRYIKIYVGDFEEHFTGSVQNSITTVETNVKNSVDKTIAHVIINQLGLKIVYSEYEPEGDYSEGDIWFDNKGGMFFWNEESANWIPHPFNNRVDAIGQEVENVIKQADADRTEAVQKINQAVIDSKVYADEVTTVSALRTKVLASDVITADMIQSNVSVVDKLFATDANVNILTAKTAFVNSIKAVEISADKVTGGTANFANFNAINFNANSITTGTISGANSDWNLNTGIMNFRDPSTGDNLKFAQGRIEFQNGAQGRQLLYNAEGLQIRPFSSNTGTSRNTALHLIGGGTGSYQYIQFISGDGIQHRIESEDRNITLYHSAGGGGVRVANYGGNTWGGSVESGIFKTAHTTGNVIQMAGERIETPRFGDRNIRLMPNGTGSVIAGDGNGNQWNMVARTFVQQSTRASKTNIETYTGSALEVVNRLEVATFNMIQELQLGINVRKVGFIAEDSEPIAVKQDGAVVGIDTYTTSAYLVKAVQELDVRTATETDKLKARVTELERKVRQLEEAA